MSVITHHTGQSPVFKMSGARRACGIDDDESSHPTHYFRWRRPRLTNRQTGRRRLTRHYFVLRFVKVYPRGRILTEIEFFHLQKKNLYSLEFFHLHVPEVLTYAFLLMILLIVIQHRYTGTLPVDPNPHVPIDKNERS
jgi:hypothetical protein